ncbi:UNVERIFIED_CONTAM: hypothetical protein O8I53_06545 [Campylobacter lari]
MSISNKEEISKIFKGTTNETFKYAAKTEYAKYDLENYFLNRYGATEKYIQL